MGLHEVLSSEDTDMENLQVTGPIGQMAEVSWEG